MAVLQCQGWGLEWEEWDTVTYDEDIWVNEFENLKSWDFPEHFRPAEEAHPFLAKDLCSPFAQRQFRSFCFVKYMSSLGNTFRRGHQNSN